MFLAALSYDLSMSNFWNLESMMIVLGGTLSATAIAFRLNEVKRVFGLIGFVFKKPAFQLGEVVDDIVALGEAYRKDRQTLEQQATTLKNRFLQDGITFISQGVSLDDLREMMMKREEYRERREANEAGLMKTLGTYSPAFGMVGTLIGLIMMLLGMGAGDGGDMAAKLGLSMSIALITTFYGAVLANLLFLPFHLTVLNPCVSIPLKSVLICFPIKSTIYISTLESFAKLYSITVGGLNGFG